ncbi:MAG: hypothetical protein IPN29_11435 [Saprospiraceae bacterium]|nr:hypothetical protein [Saprospiraceae bacterium]
MEKLQDNYQEAMRQIADAIQNSETLAAYLEEEDETLYKTLQEQFEPAIHEVYEIVANESPLQLENLEKALLDPVYEGLYLPKILGYAVLRGHVDKTIRYAVPQNHFKDILLAICNSPNFEQIKKRIGQTTQIGFALSSDIWITNLIESIENKKIKAFLASLKSDALRDTDKRREAFKGYKNQFAHANYHSAEFPNNAIQMVSGYQSLKAFLLFRALSAENNASLLPHLKNFIINKELRGPNEFLDILLIIGLMFPVENGLEATYTQAFKELYNGNSKVISDFFMLYDELYNDDSVSIKPQHEIQLASLLATVDSAELQAYFNTVNEVHNKGFVHPDAIDAVRAYYDGHKGLSQENECVRAVIMGYITKFLDNLEPEQYTDYFEINKIITAYIGIFSNEKFNQDIKESSMKFVTNCFRKYTDKRSKDYQDIKKFVASTFVELGFLTDKQVVEMFKTKRKPAAS